jgi:hypothetical protein
METDKSRLYKLKEDNSKRYSDYTAKGRGSPKK